MTQSKNRLMAMTAIAAVLDLATPAIAQDAQSAPVTAAPDPLSPTPPTAEPTSSTEPAPSTTTAVDPLSATTAVEAAPAAMLAPATQVRTTPRRATNAPAAVRRATPVRPVARTTAAPSPTATSIAPVEAVKMTAPLAAPIVAARPPSTALPAPVEAAPAVSASNDVLPIAAAGGLGLLALLGAGLAVRRRKRRDDEAEYEAFDQPTYEEPKAPVAYAEPMREPSMTRPPVMAAAVPIDASAATLSNGFDLSRFGPHVQAAYRGPSEDNNSLSLKNRLHRASAMDQMETAPEDTAPAAAPRPLAAATAARDTGAVVSKMRPAPSTSTFILGGDAPRPAMRPVTQH